MKNNKFKIMVLFFVVLAFIGNTEIAEASTANINISPPTLNKIIGDDFSISVEVNPAGNTIYAVEGSLIFTNLSCSSITLVDGIMAQTSPTCLNPQFVLGIPSGATINKKLFNVSVATKSVGVATIEVTGANIVGAGVSVSTESIGGTYSIDKKSIKNTIKPVEETTIKKSTKSVVEPKTTVSKKVSETVEVEDLKNNNQLAQVAGLSVGLFGTWIITLMLMIISFFGGYIFSQRSKK